MNQFLVYISSSFLKLRLTKYFSSCPLRADMWLYSPFQMKVPQVKCGQNEFLS